MILAQTLNPGSAGRITLVFIHVLWCSDRKDQPRVPIRQTGGADHETAGVDRCITMDLLDNQGFLTSQAMCFPLITS